MIPIKRNKRIIAFRTKKYLFAFCYIFLPLFILHCSNIEKPISNLPGDQDVPNSPSNLQANAVSSSQIALSWTDNSENETGFRIERSMDSSFTSSVSIEISEDTIAYSDSGLSEDTEYYYRIKSYKDDLESDYSNQASATTYNETEVLYDPIDISIPVYDSDNIEHYLIDENSDWDHINDSDKRIFFVAPGDYSVRVCIEFTESGTEDNPRYLVYYDPDNPSDDTHPVHMQANKRAIINMFWLLGASYWIFDRITVLNSDTRNRIIGRGKVGRPDVRYEGFPVEAGTSGPFSPSEHNVFNRMLFEDADENTLIIYEGCNYNTIQNCVIRKNTHPDGDWVGICLQAWHGIAGRAEIFGTRIIANEIYDVNDGIQLFNHAIIQDQGLTPNHAGTIIANNDIYITQNIYSDGAGNLDPNGIYAAAENALDIKAATNSSSPEDWVRIVNNRMWGFRYLDTNLAGSNADGFAVVIHDGGSSINDVDTGYILFQNNIIMDTVNGISIQDHHNISVLDNIIYDIKRLGHDGDTHPYEQSMALLLSGHNNEIYNNILIQGDYSWIWGGGDGHDWDFRNNMIIDFVRQDLSPDANNVEADYNAYYDSLQLALPGTNDLSYNSAEDSDNDTLNVVIKRITGPETVQILYGETTENSPHYGNGDPNLGSRPDMGVDDRLF